MSGIDWSFVIGCWIGSAIVCAIQLAYQMWKRRRERQQRARERAAREAEAAAAFVALLDEIRRKMQAQLGERVRVAVETRAIDEGLN